MSVSEWSTLKREKLSPSALEQAKKWALLQSWIIQTGFPSFSLTTTQLSLFGLKLQNDFNSFKIWPLQI